MKRILIYIIGFVIATAVASAQDYETDFRELQKQFEERLRTTSNNLRTYMEMYPHTPYSDEVLLMDGVLQAEKKKYKQAIRTFGKVVKGMVPDCVLRSLGRPCHMRAHKHSD